MCGFAGFIQSSTVVPGEGMAALAGAMADTLQHRGPDDRGVWADADHGVALGHRRLSIIDLSAEGHQPMHSASGRYVIAFNGEIYNFEVLRRELEREGFSWRGHSDTEVMLAAFDRWGVEAALRRFNGMFAFAMWDRAEKLLHLARDRVGEKPLYYGWIGNTFVFGSQLKALRAHPAWRGEIDRDALATYLRHNYVPAPYSIYRGIAKLRPGQYLKVAADPSRPLMPQAYWSMRDVAEAGVREPLIGTEQALTDELDTLLRDAVKMRMVADVPVGVFLSGGVDSSTVAALMQAQAMSAVKTFSIGFKEEDYDEARYAKAVAAHLGTDHTELYVTPHEAMSVVPRLPEAYDEPFSDSSQIPTLLVSQLARKKVTVSLSGDGGDELFCGYVRYFWGRRVWTQVSRMPYAMRSLGGSALKMLSPDGWNGIFRRMPQFIQSVSGREVTGIRLHKLANVLAMRSPDKFYQGLVSHWSEPNAAVVGGREAATVLSDSNQWPALDDFTLRMMYFDSVMYLPDDILVKVDRASMAYGLEARVPLLDHRVVEFASRVPLSMKIRNDQGKWLLRQVLHRYVPRELIERPKMGFGIPIDAWLKGPLREWAEELLNERRLREEGFLDPHVVRKKWREHVSGADNWEYALWDVLMFQAWLEKERREATPASREPQAMGQLS